MKKRNRTAKSPAKKPVLSVVEQLRALNLPNLVETTERTIASGVGAIQIIGGLKKPPGKPSDETPGKPGA
jgi:hypothetical protein